MVQNIEKYAPSEEEKVHVFIGVRGLWGDSAVVLVAVVCYCASFSRVVFFEESSISS